MLETFRLWPEGNRPSKVERKIVRVDVRSKWVIAGFPRLDFINDRDPLLLCSLCEEESFIYVPFLREISAFFGGLHR